MNGSRILSSVLSVFSVAQWYLLFVNQETVFFYQSI